MQRRAETQTAPLVMVALVVAASLQGCRAFGLVGVVDHDAERPFDASLLDAALRDAAADGGNHPIVLDDCGPENLAGLSASDIALLRGGGTPAATQRYLYPYDGTVFPGGISAPVVMWDGPSGDAVLLRLHSQTFEYDGCLKVSSPGQLTIPARAWNGAQAAGVGASNPIEMQLTTLANGRASGPMSRSFVIASAPLHSAIYYMSYGLTGTPSILRIAPQQSAALQFAATNCTGCHAVSANGTRMLGFSQGTGTVFSIDAASNSPNSLRTQLSGAEYAAVYPDGSLYVTTSHLSGAGTRYFSVPSLTAMLVDVASGTTYPNAGIPPGAMVPAFSASGSLLAFNDYAIDNGHGLAVMDFDANTKAATNYRMVFRDATAYPGWPSFVPDEKLIVFARGQAADFSAMGAQISTQSALGPNSDLYSVSITGGDATLLAHAMGYNAVGDPDSATYLPFGLTDLHQNYDPSVSTAASGGYAWLFFDSVRHYGNQGVMRQLWGAAIDVSSTGTYASDPSHPPFYIPGQSTSAANLRAISVVEPCAMGDSTCTSASSP